MTRSRLPIGQTLTAATNQKPGGAGARGLITCSVIAPAPPPQRSTLCEGSLAVVMRKTTVP